MNYSSARQPLIDAGYRPIPIVHGDKRPAVKGWESPEFKAPSGYNNGNGVGIVCGIGDYPIAGVDIDIVDPDIAKALVDYVMGKYGTTILRVGRNPKTMLVYLHSHKGIRKKTSRRYNIGRVEILGAGQQFVAHGTHPDTKKPYSWPGSCGDILATPAKELPILSEEACDDIVKYADELMSICGYTLIEDKTTTIQSDYDPLDPLDYTPPLGLSLSELKSHLDKLDPDCGRDQWVGIGMALHYETNGSDDGLQLWDEWSSIGTKYKEGEPEKQWESFGKYKGRPITAAYILKLAKPKEEVPPDPNFFKNLNWSTKRFVDNPPSIPMVVEGMMPKGITSLFYSAGGAGKSTLVLHLAVKIAIANEYEMTFCGHVVNGGRTVILTAEDPELILNRRFVAILKAIAEEYDLKYDALRQCVDKYMSIVSTQGKAVHLFKMSESGNLKPTTYYTSFMECLSELDNLQLICVDTKSRYSPAEDLGNVIATEEITYYEALTQKTGASVLLLHHTNKLNRDSIQKGREAFRGVTALYDSVRAAWLLREMSTEEIRAQGEQELEGVSYLLLDNSKNNYIARHPDMVIRREGFSYKHQLPTPRLTNLEHRNLKKQDDFEFLMQSLQSNPKTELKQLEIIDILADRVCRTSARKLLKEAKDLALVETRTKQSTIYYTLTEEGRLYHIKLDEEFV